MKKRAFIVAIVLLLFFVSAFSVFAAPVGMDLEVKPSREKTPGLGGKTAGARATENFFLHATQGKGEKKENFKGVVATVGDSDLAVTLADGSTVPFALTEDTRISIPTLGKTATAANLLVGMQVNVRAEKGDAGLYIALSVSATPGKPTKVHQVGVVIAYQMGVSISIEASDGNSYTFTLSEDAKILPSDRIDQLKVGSRVTIISPRDVVGGESIAAGIVIHPDGTGADGEMEQEKPPKSEGSSTPEALTVPEESATP